MVYTPDNKMDSLAPRLDNMRPARLTWQCPSPEHVRSWAKKLAPHSVLVVEGPSFQHRSEIYHWIYETKPLGEDTFTSAPNHWLTEGVVNSFISRMGNLSLHHGPSVSFDGWRLLHRLTTLRELVVEGDLLELIDQAAPLSAAFKVLWEARFAVQEHHDPRPFLGQIKGWFGADMAAQQRLDLVYLFLTLARQNKVFDRTILIFDGLEEALQQKPARRKVLLAELLDLVRANRRWAAMGSGTGLVLGFAGKLPTLESYNRKLYEELRSSELGAVSLT